MTEWQQECMNELERQMNTFIRVILTESQFQCLRDLSAGSGWVYKTIYNKSYTKQIYELWPSDAKLVYADIQQRIADQVAAKLTA